VESRLVECSLSVGRDHLEVDMVSEFVRLGKVD